MRAREFVNEISYMDQTIPDYLQGQRRHQLLGTGLDQQAFATPTGRGVLKVFGGRQATSAPGVIPTKTPSQAMYDQWVAYCAAHARSNPFLPRFYRLRNGAYTQDRVYNGRLYIISFQERLMPGGSSTRELSRLTDYMDRNRGAHYPEIVTALTDPDRAELDPDLRLVLSRVRNVLESTNLDRAQLLEFINTARELQELADANNWGWDLHADNIMRRANGTPVIVDPWHMWVQSWSEISPSNRTNSDRTRFS